VKNLNHFQTRPKVAPINIGAYLNELGLLKELPSKNYLRQLHRAHLIRFPFENLDVHLRKNIVLQIRPIFNKIILSKRGGFCYELNLLFYHLLIHLGYDCQLISAKTYNQNTDSYGKEYDHMAILVKIQQDIYLCDVGFGNGVIYPVKLETEILQMDHTHYVQFTQDVDETFFLRKSNDGHSFQTLYQFEPKMREPIEFIDMCNYHQTNPQSFFVGKKIITKLTEAGKITLTDELLKIQEKGSTHEIVVLNEDDFYTKMEEHFGITYQSLLHG
jgi:N-hydroxyarylamine O-acetyltransferase